jgi:hypothetical protein
VRPDGGESPAGPERSILAQSCGGFGPARRARLGADRVAQHVLDLLRVEVLLVRHDDRRPIEAGDELAARKVFHVSHFFPVRGEYRFRFTAAFEAALAAGDVIVAGFARGDFETHFPRRFSLATKLLAMLPYRLFFPLVRGLTGL